VSVDTWTTLCLNLLGNCSSAMCLRVRSFGQRRVWREREIDLEVF
jgi:hypothetical protein